MAVFFGVFFLVITLFFLFGQGGVKNSSEFLTPTELPPTNDPFELGQYYFNHGKYADGTYDLYKARSYFEQAATENPSAYPILWYQLGRVDFLLSRFDSAIAKFEKQIEYFGDKPIAVYYMLGLTYGYKARDKGGEENWESSAENFLKYLEHNPISPWAKVDLSWVYFSQGRFDEMLPILDSGLEDWPSNAWLLNMKGLALLNTGDTVEAEKQFELAKLSAEILTPEDWGKSYPGNDPKAWSRGLEEFRSAIDKNLELTKTN